MCIVDIIDNIQVPTALSCIVDTIDIVNIQGPTAFSQTVISNRNRRLDGFSLK